MGATLWHGYSTSAFVRRPLSIDLHPRDPARAARQLRGVLDVLRGPRRSASPQRRDLEKKRTRSPPSKRIAFGPGGRLVDPAGFYRNCVIMHDDPRHAGSEDGAADLPLQVCPPRIRRDLQPRGTAPGRMTESNLDDREDRAAITCAKSSVTCGCFREIFRTFHLDQVEWAPLGAWMSRMYRCFPCFPNRCLPRPRSSAS